MTPKDQGVQTLSTTTRWCSDVKTYVTGADGFENYGAPARIRQNCMAICFCTATSHEPQIISTLCRDEPRGKKQTKNSNGGRSGTTPGGSTPTTLETARRINLDVGPERRLNEMFNMFRNQVQQSVALKCVHSNQRGIIQEICLSCSHVQHAKVGIVLQPPDSSSSPYSSIQIYVRASAVLK